MHSPRRFYQRPWFQLTAGIAVTLACLGWAFRSMTAKEDPATVFRKIGDSFSQADYRSLPIMAGLVLLFFWLKSWRWSWLLRPVGRYSIRELFPPVMIGFAFNNLLPAHLGEFVRVYVFSRQHRVNQGTALSTVVLERVFDLLAILGFFFLGLAFTPGLREDVKQMASLVAVFVALGLIVAGAYLVWTRPVVAIVESLLARISFIPANLRSRICRLMEEGAAGLASLKSGWLIAGIAMNSIAQWAINGLMMHIALWSFGIDVSPLTSCLLLGVVAMMVMMPASPGYFGVVQAAFVITINEQTVKLPNTDAVFSPATVFAASIYFHMTQYVIVTVLGLIYFNLTGMKMSEVRHEAEEAEDLSAPEELQVPTTQPMHESVAR